MKFMLLNYLISFSYCCFKVEKKKEYFVNFSVFIYADFKKEKNNIFNLIYLNRFVEFIFIY